MFHCIASLYVFSESEILRNFRQAKHLQPGFNNSGELNFWNSWTLGKARPLEPSLFYKKAVARRILKTSGVKGSFLGIWGDSFIRD